MALCQSENKAFKDYPICDEKWYWWLLIKIYKLPANALGHLFFHQLPPAANSPLGKMWNWALKTNPIEMKDKHIKKAQCLEEMTEYKLQVLEDQDCFTLSY